LQQAADRDHVLSEVQSAAHTKASSELNLAVAVFSGGGGVGKTSACLAIQGEPLPEERESTRGGDGTALVVRVKQEKLLGFEKPRGDLNHLQRALLQRLWEERACASGDNDNDENDDNLSRFVSSRDAYSHIAEVQAQLVAMGGGLAAAMIDELEQVPAGSPTLSEASSGSPPDGSGGAGPSPGPGPAMTAVMSAIVSSVAAATPLLVVPEQIDVTRESAIVMRAQQEAGGREEQDGVHTLILDLGGQPEFWTLVGEFLRE
jgi:hypothetical protein